MQLITITLDTLQDTNATTSLLELAIQISLAPCSSTSLIGRTAPGAGQAPAARRR